MALLFAGPAFLCEKPEGKIFPTALQSLDLFYYILHRLKRPENINAPGQPTGLLFIADSSCAAVINASVGYIA